MKGSFFFVLSLVRCISDLEYFLDNDIRMFLSTANHIFLVRNQATDAIEHVSKYARLDDVFSTFKISRNKGRYLIASDTDFLCEKKGKIEICDERFRWEIKPKVLGFTISNKDNCITILPERSVALKKCTGSEDQMFDFKLADEDQECDQKAESRKEANQIVIKVEHPKDEIRVAKTPLFNMLCNIHNESEKCMTKNPNVVYI